MRPHRLAFVVSIALVLNATAALAAEEEEVRRGEAAFGDWSQDEPGVRRLIKPGDMPAPAVEESAANRAETIAMPEGAKPEAADGFSVEMVASGLQQPRVIRKAPNGDLFVAESDANSIRVYRVPPGSAKPEAEEVFASGLNRPYGIAFYPLDNPEWVYVANEDSVVRFPYEEGDLKASGEPETIVSGLPTGGHWTRDLAFAADGSRLYVSVGSNSNVAEEMEKEPPAGFIESHPLGAAWGNEERRAAVLSFDPEGKDEKTFATGIRNCSGLAIHPDSKELWCATNERDGLGDNVPFEYVTSVWEGGFYGWPWYYIGEHEEPRLAGARPDLADDVTVPDVLIQAHSAPLGIAFYTGRLFPEEYQGDAFVTLHGSWNRGKRTGYKVVRLLFEDGKPTGEYEDFLTGFVVSDDEVWGRPVGAAVAKDGSLFITEDGSGTIWRVAPEAGPS
jgi:glucose/arabinose dehydrogenase